MKDFFLPTISPSNKVIFNNNYSSKPKISQLYKLAHYNYIYEKDYNQALLKSYITNDSKSINKKKIEPSNYYALSSQIENSTENTPNTNNSYKIIYKRKKQNKINLKRNVANDNFSTPRYINTQSSQSSKYSFPNISTQESDTKTTDIKKKPSGLKDLEIKFKYITTNRKYESGQNINVKENL
jgi:hypothetical protein